MNWFSCVGDQATDVTHLLCEVKTVLTKAPSEKIYGILSVNREI